MADFWTNDFNVFYGKNLERAYLAGYIERTVRANALGRFEDLLITTAESPEMLIYLDNASSVAPGSTPPRAGHRGSAVRTWGGFRRPFGDRRIGRAGREPVVIVSRTTWSGWIRGCAGRGRSSPSVSTRTTPGS